MGNLTLEQLLEECRKRGLIVAQPTKQNKFYAIARFNRGLGPEYFNIKSFEANTVDEANSIAYVEAERFLANTDGMEKAILNEVRIKPE